MKSKVDLSSAIVRALEADDLSVFRSVPESEKSRKYCLLDCLLVLVEVADMLQLERTSHLLDIASDVACNEIDGRPISVSGSASVARRFIAEVDKLDIAECGDIAFSSSRVVRPGIN